MGICGVKPGRPQRGCLRGPPSRMPLHEGIHKEMTEFCWAHKGCQAGAFVPRKCYHAVEGRDQGTGGCQQCQRHSHTPQAAAAESGGTGLSPQPSSSSLSSNKEMGAWLSGVPAVCFIFSFTRRGGWRGEGLGFGGYWQFLYTSVSGCVVCASM